MSKLLYEGSVKNLWAGDQNGFVEFEYTNAYSVFDWGRMPDLLEGKGAALASIGAHFFKVLGDPGTWRSLRQHSLLSKTLQNLDPSFRAALEHELSVLCESGLAHHFVQKSAENRFVVQQVPILKPQVAQWGARTLYHYTNGQAASPTRLLPLEVVFRWGMPSGSSLKERLTADYAREIGFSSVPSEGQAFSFPVLEFFTKLEPTDRFLTWEQALNYAAISLQTFQTLVARTQLLCVFLKAYFDERGLELWDGKFEWALKDGQLLLVDSIGPDELRLLFSGTNLQVSKEFLRQFYRKNSWYENLQKMKKEINGKDWKHHMSQKHGEPPRLSPEYLQVAEVLYPVLEQVIVSAPGNASAQLKLLNLKERMRACQNS